MDAIPVELAAVKIGLKPKELIRRLALPDTNPFKPNLIYYVDDAETLVNSDGIEKFIKHSEARQGQAEVPTDTELQLIFSMAAQRRHAKRDRALLALSNYSGLRCAEIAKLNLADVYDEQAGDLLQKTVIKRSQTKAKAARVAFFAHPKLIAYLWPHVQQRLAQGATGADPLFMGEKSKKRYQAARLAALFKQIYSFCGFDRLSSHSGRARLATALIKNGADLKTAQQALGHKSEATTMRYIRHTDEEVAGSIAELA